VDLITVTEFRGLREFRFLGRPYQNSVAIFVHTYDVLPCLARVWRHLS